jgi:hypothetical protein
VGLGLLLVLGVAAEEKESAMDARVKGFDAAFENFGRSGEMRDLDRGNSRRLQGLGGAAGGKDFDSMVG